MRLIRGLLLLVVAFVAWCGVAEAREPMAQRIISEVHLNRVVDVTHLSTSGMNLYVEVENDTGHRIVVTDAELDILSHGEVIATISLRDKLVLKRRSTDVVLIPLRFKSRSSFVLGRLLSRIITKDVDITLNYRIRGGVGLFRRTFHQEGIEARELINRYGDSEMIIQQIEEYIR